MQFKHEQGRYFLEDPKAEIVYHYDNDRIIIEHTQVAPQLQGQNIGRELVERVVEEAREKKIKISPLCTFARKMLTGSAEYADVL